ncbi:hypothetical protein [Haematobacter massiliensis]|nr:hypothetical protein [Haematobacter massiliensis]
MMKSTVSALAAGAILLSSTVASFAGSVAAPIPEPEPVVVVGETGSMGGAGTIAAIAAAVAVVALIADDSSDSRRGTATTTN